MTIGDMMDAAKKKGMFVDIQIGAETIEALGELIRHAPVLKSKWAEFGYKSFLVKDGENKPALLRVLGKNSAFVVATADYADDGSLIAVHIQFDNNKYYTPFHATLKAGQHCVLRMCAEMWRFSFEARKAIFRFFKGLTNDTNTLKMPIPNTRWLTKQTQSVSDSLMKWLEDHIQPLKFEHKTIQLADGIAVHIEYRDCGDIRLNSYHLTFDVLGLGVATAGSILLHDNQWRTSSHIPEIVHTLLKAYLESK